ncbi:MAG: hypothetical protein LBR06_05245 [Bacteroidales bacterium]|nr:hypothetical protein [Bacteroidales bacterium]
MIYLDPPFFSNRNYEVIWGEAGEVRSFQYRWSGRMYHYIAWLKERVEQMVVDTQNPYSSEAPLVAAVKLVS